MPHHVNSQSIPVEIGIVFRENAKIPETGTKMTNVLKYFYQLGTEVGWLNNNKGINAEYVWALHGSVVELHVGGADQQELEQQGSPHSGLISGYSSWLERL